MLPSIYDIIENMIFLNYLKTKKCIFAMDWFEININFNNYDFGQIFDAELNEDIKVK